MKKAVVSVINDLVTDQRVHKVCTTLKNVGFEVLLVGRVKKDSLPMPDRNYQTQRMKLIFEKGPLFYAEYNIRLWLFLLFKKSDILISNDLDTLLPNYIISRTKNIPMVYDSHEYFTETPELNGRPVVQKIWKTIEKFIFPKLRHVFTVNDSIAALFKNEYGNDVKVVRNIPPLRSFNKVRTKEEMGLPIEQKLIILQGAGINMDRGTEELVEAMQYIENTTLLIVGGGDVIDVLKQMTEDLKLKSRIQFIPKQPFEMLYNYTIHADIGITIDKDTNINYRYSLPNKLFDYIHAGVPVLASKLVEIQNIIEKYNIGDTIDNHEPIHIAKKLTEMLETPEKLDSWKENTKFASLELNWEKEEEQLLKVYQLYV